MTYFLRLLSCHVSHRSRRMDRWQQTNVRWLQGRCPNQQLIPNAWQCSGARRLLFHGNRHQAHAPSILQVMHGSSTGITSTTIYHHVDSIEQLRHHSRSLDAAIAAPHVQTPGTDWQGLHDLDTFLDVLRMREGSIRHHEAGNIAFAAFRIATRLQPGLASRLIVPLGGQKVMDEDCQLPKTLRLSKRGAETEPGRRSSSDGYRSSEELQDWRIVVGNDLNALVLGRLSEMIRLWEVMVVGRRKDLEPWERRFRPSSIFDLMQIYGVLGRPPPEELQRAVSSSLRFLSSSKPWAEASTGFTAGSSERCATPPPLLLSQVLVSVTRSSASSGAQDPSLWEAVGLAAKQHCFLFQPSDLIAILDAKDQSGSPPSGALPLVTFTGHVLDALSDRLLVSMPFPAAFHGHSNNGSLPISSGFNHAMSLLRPQALTSILSALAESRLHRPDLLRAAIAEASRRLTVGTFFALCTCCDNPIHSLYFSPLHPCATPCPPNRKTPARFRLPPVGDFQSSICQKYLGLVLNLE